MELYKTFAKERLTKLAGGALAEANLAEAFVTIDKDYSVGKYAGMYLAGSSERAEGNLANLDNLLTEMFLADLADFENLNFVVENNTGFELVFDFDKGIIRVSEAVK